MLPSVSDLPLVNASLNGVATVLLIVGYACIRRRRITAHRTAMTVEAGYVWINEVAKHFLGAPFGGWKQSGVGREGGNEGIAEYLETKYVAVNL